ncbi:MAG: ABC transporter ATP-binding protein [Oscillospiraceae bacterium]
MSEKILEVKNLKTYFHSENGTVKAVDDVSFYVEEGETLGIVGESGCGKSISCMSIARLVETPPGKYEGGEIIFDGKDMLKISDAEMRKIRGNDISYIFQEPMTSLNPIFRIGSQISEALVLHQGMKPKQALEESIKMLDLVRIPNPERVVNDYPFALSGGMRQRVMIAMALACKPKLLIADEPTTALDVTIQAQVLDLMNYLKTQINSSIIFITHDLGVIAEMCERVMVMYAGKIVEVAPVEEIFARPMHPYTIGLINSRPDMNTNTNRLNVIPGNVPDLNDMPTGCPFNPRCSKATERCRRELPHEIKVGEKHAVRCWEYEK